jgi:hypothetical protein
MQRRPEKKAVASREALPHFGPVAALALVIVIALVVYAVIWVSHNGLNPDSSNLLQPPAATPSSPTESEWSAKSVQAIGLAHISADLESATLSQDRLAEFHTMDEIFDRTPNPAVPADQRINNLQHGTYPDLNAKLKNVLGEPLNNAILQYAEMSRAEKLLLYYDWVGTPTREDAVSAGFISMMNAANITEITGYGMLDAAWTEGDRQELTAIYRQSGGDETKLKALLTEQWLPRYCSPVALRLFEPWHKEWAAGMGYICEVRDTAQRNAIVAAVLDIQLQQGLRDLQPFEDARKGIAIRPEIKPAKPADSMEYYKFFYYRVYGEKKGTVLAEGIMQVESFQARQHRWDPQPATKQ